MHQKSYLCLCYSLALCPLLRVQRICQQSRTKLRSVVILYYTAFLRVLNVTKQQGLITSSLSDLYLVQSRVAALSLFSPNETIDDISSRDLVYLFVPYVLAEVENKARTVDHTERLERIGRAQVSYFYLRRFR